MDSWNLWSTLISAFNASRSQLKRSKRISFDPFSCLWQLTLVSHQLAKSSPQKRQSRGTMTLTHTHQRSSSLLAFAEGSSKHSSKQPHASACIWGWLDMSVLYTEGHRGPFTRPSKPQASCHISTTAELLERSRFVRGWLNTQSQALHFSVSKISLRGKKEIALRQTPAVFLFKGYIIPHIFSEHSADMAEFDSCMFPFSLPSVVNSELVPSTQDIVQC